MTRKAPTGVKHDPCYTHVPHTYPKSGWLCITTREETRAAEMVAFADHLAEVAARHRAAELERPAPDGSFVGESLCRKRGCTVYMNADNTAHRHPAGDESWIYGTPGDRAAIAALSARLDARQGRPAADTYAAAVARVTPDPVRPVKVARRRNVTRRQSGAILAAYGAGPVQVNINGVTVAETRRIDIAEPVAPEPVPDALALCNACDIAPAEPSSPAGYCADCERAAHAPEPTPAAESRCWHYLHTAGGTRRCVIQPDHHAGAHDYEPVVTPIGPRPEPIAEPTHPYRFDDTIVHPGASRIDCAECHVQPVAPVLAAVPDAPTADARPTCPRCGQTFRKSGNGHAWHVANRPDCAAGRLSVVA